MQEALIIKLSGEQESLLWGFICVWTYGQTTERVTEFNFLGLHFDERSIRKKLVNYVVSECEKNDWFYLRVRVSVWDAGHDTQYFIV